jgi:hypothetical protein
VYNYAVSLAKRGEECYVVAPMADGGYRGGYPFELVDFISMEVPASDSTARHPTTGYPLRRAHPLHRSRRHPRALAVCFRAGGAAARAQARHSVIGMFHSRYYDDFYQLTRAEMLANFAVATIVNFYHRCDEVWTVSQSSAETLVDYGYNGEIVVMPNARRT